MNSYKVLNNQIFSDGEFSIVPIRSADKLKIMKWRNEQIYHLRQNTLLTEDDQIKYFQNTVSCLFGQPNPKQILFSYLHNCECIGYGGLVHINWIDRNAEISFIMDTHLEARYFDFNWQTFLKLLERVAFGDLKLHKLYVYAFDLRPHLYTTLKSSGYFLDAVLKEHCLFQGEYIDVVIHSKLSLS